MTQDPDAYAIWGDWDLQQFKVAFAKWRDSTHPPAESLRNTDRWWRRLKQPMEWGGAQRVSRELDPEGTLRWMWVPDGGYLDEHRGFYRVQCWFRVYELDRPPRLVCEEFRTLKAMTPTEVDLSDGMG